jgi:glycine/D-amino acid oxidase-like deaminating enzyme
VSDAVRRVLNSRKTVTVVGSGISGLMTAYKLMKEGYKVSVLTQSPNPLTSNADTLHQASTFDGQDQRYITIFEGHPYLAFLEYVAKVYPGIGEDFQKSALRGGWLALSPEQFNEQTQNWLAKRDAFNKKLESGDLEAIAQVKAEFQKYTEENRASMLEWYYLLIELIKENPQIVHEISLQYDGIIRLYDTEEVFKGAVKSHEDEKVIKRTLTPQELAAEMPAYAAGVTNGFIKGGAVEMHGLTIGIQSFCKSLIKTMQSKGVEFAFDTLYKANLTQLNILFSVLEDKDIKPIADFILRYLSNNSENSLESQVKV